MKTVRRPPYPKWNPGYFPCSSLTPLPLSSRRPSVSFGGFGVTGERSSPARRRHPAQAYSEASTTLLHTTPPRPDLNGLSRRWEAALAALDAQMDAGDADDTAIDNGAVRTCHAAQEAHSTPDGKVERCSEGEAQGVVDSRGRPGTRHPSGHGKEVHGSSEPAHEARSGRIGAICYHREQYK